jgi:hypothetical protein
VLNIHAGSLVFDSITLDSEQAGSRYQLDNDLLAMNDL